MTPHRRLLGLIIGAALAGAGNSVATGQTLTLTPSLTTVEEYDDNVRLTATNRQSDFVTALQPRLRLDFKDHPWYVTFAGALRGELFAKETALDNFGDNRTATATVEFRPTGPFSLSLSDTYVRSLNPGNVAPQQGVSPDVARAFPPQAGFSPGGVPTTIPAQTGLITGRFAATSNTVAPALAYQVTPLTAVSFRYSFNVLRSDAPLTRDSDTHSATVALQHQLTRRTSGTLDYSFTRFQIEGSPDRDSHSSRLGFSYAYSPSIRLSSSTGVLLLEQADGSQTVTVASSTGYDQDFRNGHLALAYNRNAGVAGLTGVASVTQSLSGALAWQPIRPLTINLNSSYSDTQLSEGAADFQAYTAEIRISYRLLRWLFMEGGYRFQRQENPAGSFNLTRNVLFLGLTASDQFRMY